MPAANLLLATDPPWFVVAITDDANAPAYDFEEVWLDPTGAAVTKVGGRYGADPINPGYPLDSGHTFAVGDLALARSGSGAGGILWELWPHPSAGGGASVANAQASLGTDYTCTGTMAATGLSIALPAAGDYLLFSRLNGQLDVTTLTTGGVAAYLNGELYDNTTAAYINASGVSLCVQDATATFTRGSATISCLYTASGANTIQLHAQRVAGSAWNISKINGVTGSGAFFATNLGYLKLS